MFTGMSDRIKKSQSWDDVQMSKGKIKMSPKLFILLPESCYAPTSLTVVDVRAKVDGRLEDLVLDRAGVASRPYRNSVHKITKNNKEVIDLFFKNRLII